MLQCSLGDTSELIAFVCNILRFEVQGCPAGLVNLGCTHDVKLAQVAWKCLCLSVAVQCLSSIHWMAMCSVLYPGARLLLALAH